MPTDFASRCRSTISASANAIASSIDHASWCARVNRPRERAHRRGADVVEPEVAGAAEIAAGIEVAGRPRHAASARWPRAPPGPASLRRLRELSEDEAFQVVGLGHAEQHRMIAALHPLLDHRHVRLRVDARVVDDLGERRLVDVVRAAAGDQRAARIEQLQRAQVDLLVAGARVRRPPPCSWRTPAGRARSCRTARPARSRPRSSSNTLPTRASTGDAVARGVRA